MFYLKNFVPVWTSVSNVAWIERWVMKFKFENTFNSLKAQQTQRAGLTVFSLNKFIIYYYICGESLLLLQMTISFWA